MKTTTLLMIAAAVLARSDLRAQPGHGAVYQVTFEATWSADTHPDMFPPNPHFSWLIGGTHDDQVDFWTPGETASLGIRRMAEWGSKTPLDQEVLAAAAAGHAGEVIESAVFPQSPGSVAATFTVTPATPLVTVVTMIAPSPDWFTGVRGLDLRDGDGWVESLSVDVFPFDAGTDSGAGYTSPDQPTDPQQPIAALTGAPFAPGVPVGTFVFTLQSSATSAPPPAALVLEARPNPFNPRLEIALEAPPGPAALTVLDARGRLVRRLWSGEADGAATVVWDGRDEAGGLVPSGAYLVRAESAGRTALRRVTLLR